MMGVKSIVKKLNGAFAGNNKDRHYYSIKALLKKLDAKEDVIMQKRESETDRAKRRKQKRSLAVIRAQKRKAQKLLKRAERENLNEHKTMPPSPISGLGSLHH